jgi:hypothetical protein
MALDSENDWIEAFAEDLPNVGNDAWKANLANLIDGLVTNKLSSPGLINSSGEPSAVFTFGKSAFQSALSNNTPAVISAAMQAGLTASTAVVEAGSYIVVDSPATKFSSIVSSIISPASIALAAAKILEIGGVPNADDPLDSAVPPIFREAFLLLKLTTTGLNSVAPTPATLVDTERAMG